MDLVNINADVMGQIERWINNTGDESGALGFYTEKIANGFVFANYEKALFRHIITSPLPQQACFYEVGCGYGQFLFALAMNGYKTYGIEVDRKRFDGAQFILEKLSDTYSDLPLLMEFSYVNYPNDFSFTRLSKDQPNVLIMTNLVSSMIVEQEDKLVQSMKYFDYVLVDAGLFGWKRNLEERKPIVAKIDKAIGTKKTLVYEDHKSELYHYEVEKGFFSKLFSMR